MKKLCRFLLFLAMLLPAAVFGQITYNFDVGGNGYSSDGVTYTNMTPYLTSTFETKTLTTLGAAAGGDANTTNVFHGLQGLPVASADLTAFASCTDQQVVWKTYFKTATSATRGGVTLRAQNTQAGYIANATRAVAKYGYYFCFYGQGSSSNVTFRIQKLDAATAVSTVKGATNLTIPGFTNGPLYLKAKAVGTSLYFEYSTNGTTFTAFPGSPFTDATYTSGTVQLAWGLGMGAVPDYYYDDVTLTDLNAVPPIAVTGNTQYYSNGSVQAGPTAYALGVPITGTVSWLYTSTGATPSYGPSAILPSALGTYKAVVSVGAPDNLTSANFNFAVVSPTITVTGSTQFVYTNTTPQGPSTSVLAGCSGAVTYTYTGIGLTTYASSTTPPTNIGTYQVVAAVTDASLGLVTSAPYNFTIVPSTKLYTFNDDVAGIAASTVDKLNVCVGNTGTFGVVSFTDAASTPVTSNCLKVYTNATTGVADLQFPSDGKDAIVIWKQYITDITKETKVGILLRASGTSSYATGLKEGYYCMAWYRPGIGIGGRVYRAHAAGLAGLDAGYGSGTYYNTIANNVPFWVKATIIGATINMSYSLDSITWSPTQENIATGITYPLLTSGSAQLVYGLGNVDNTYLLDNITFLSPLTTTGGSWSSISWTSTPNANSDITVSSGELVVDNSQTVNSFIVNPGAKLTINSGQTLTTGNVNFKSDATGTGTFVNNGGTLTTGNASMSQYVTTGRNWYLSSPVSNATSAIFDAVNSTTNKLYSYDEVNHTWPQISDNSTSLTVAKGYVANMPVSGNITFTGSLNDGNKSINLTQTIGTDAGFNLVGNPYPSYLDWSAAAVANPGVLSSIWYRTKTALNAYTFDTYNATGNVSSTNGATMVSKLIPPMQAFWVYITAPTTLIFTNAMRFHTDNSSNMLKAMNVDRQLLRLKVSSGDYSDETVIYSDAHADNGYDRYDSPKMFNNDGTTPEIYTLAGTNKLVINGLSDFKDGMEIPVAFKTAIAGSFNLRMGEQSSLNSDMSIILKDKLTNKQMDLTLGDSFTFTSDVTSGSDRFSLIFKSTDRVTSLSESSENANLSVFCNENNRIEVNCTEKLSANATVRVFNALGQQLAHQKLDSQRTVISTPTASGIYLISVSNAGKTVIKKVNLR